MALAKRSLSLHGHRTSLALEPEFWAVIDQVVTARQVSLAQLIAEIDDNRASENALSSSVRVFALTWLQNLIQTSDTNLDLS